MSDRNGRYYNVAGLVPHGQADANHKLQGNAQMTRTIQLEMDSQNRGGRISPLWFGHNLEHSRFCLWKGLSAQLIQNRKFAGPAEPYGLARLWYPIGVSGTLFQVDRTEGKWGMDGEAYTRHFGDVVDVLLLLVRGVRGVTRRLWL